MDNQLVNRPKFLPFLSLFLFISIFVIYVFATDLIPHHVRWSPDIEPCQLSNLEVSHLQTFAWTMEGREWRGTMVAVLLTEMIVVVADRYLQESGRNTRIAKAGTW